MNVWSLIYVLMSVNVYPRYTIINRFCTVQNLKCHELVHSEYKEFCCGLSSRDFKHKRYVVRHLTNVLLSWDLVTFNLCVDLYLLLSTLANKTLHSSSVHRHCQNRLCTVQKLKCHELVHWDYKQFCCGLSSRDFKHKRYVVRHLRNVRLSWDLVTFNVRVDLYLLLSTLASKTLRSSSVYRHCQNRFCTLQKLKCHELVHSDYKEFCRGFSSRDFKHKRYVVRHLRNVRLSWHLVTFYLRVDLYHCQNRFCTVHELKSHELVHSRL